MLLLLSRTFLPQICEGHSTPFRSLLKAHLIGEALSHLIKIASSATFCTLYPELLFFRALSTCYTLSCSLSFSLFTRMQPARGSCFVHFAYSAAAAKSLQSCPTLCDPTLQENIGRTLSDINHTNIFFDPSPRKKWK